MTELFPLISPCDSFPTHPFPPASFSSMPAGSGERAVTVAATSEARLPVAAGGGRRAREHHNLRRRGRRRG